MVERYYCPACDYESSSLYVIKRHYKQNHNIFYCPICKKKYKRVALHAREIYEIYGCEEHAVLYWLTTSKKIILEVKDIVEKMLSKKGLLNWDS